MCLLLQFFALKLRRNTRGNEMFIRSGMKSYEQLLQYGSFTSIAQYQRLKKSISQSDMPRILLSKGHWKILFSTSRKKCLSKQDDRKKVKP